MNVGSISGTATPREKSLHKTVSRPLREEGKGDNNAHAAAVTWCRDKGAPADICRNVPVKSDGCFDFLEFILNKGIIPISIRVIVG